MLLDILGQVDFGSVIKAILLFFDHYNLDGGSAFQDVFLMADCFFGGERAFANNHSDLGSS